MLCTTSQPQYFGYLSESAVQHGEGVVDAGHELRRGGCVFLTKLPDTVQHVTCLRSLCYICEGVEGEGRRERGGGRGEEGEGRWERGEGRGEEGEERRERGGGRGEKGEGRRERGGGRYMHTDH